MNSIGESTISYSITESHNFAMFCTILKKYLIEHIYPIEDKANHNRLFNYFFSAIVGYNHEAIRPFKVGSACELLKEKCSTHLIFTAETHNFPTGVAPFSGATTGTGGRIRDVQAVGRGGYCIAGTAGYCVGNLRIPGKG